MAFLSMSTTRSVVAAALLLICVLLIPCLHADAKLSTKFYDKTCPRLQTIVRTVMAKAVTTEKRMGASILRLFFHDCFVNGCDASILLDDTPTFTGEKSAGANANSVRGYEVVDDIKARVEAACSATVSCSDIVALASRDAVNLLGGPTWSVQLGRKDSRTATQGAANANLPGPSASAASLVSAFGVKGLSPRDMTALSGAHTVGQARCVLFRGRIYSDTNINATFAAARRRACPTQTSGDGNLAPFDEQTPDAFDNAYYKNLVMRRGLLHSDQELFNGGSQDALVKKYSGNPHMFANDFAKAMVKMGGLMPAAGTPTEIRLNCRKIN